MLRIFVPIDLVLRPHFMALFFDIKQDSTAIFDFEFSSCSHVDLLNGNELFFIFCSRRMELIIWRFNKIRTWSLLHFLRFVVHGSALHPLQAKGSCQLRTHSRFLVSANQPIFAQPNRPGTFHYEKR